VGGWWSGPPKRWRGTVEESRALDVLGFLREGMLSSPGGSYVWRWSSGRDGRNLGSIGVSTVGSGTPAAVELSYTFTAGEDAPIKLDYQVRIGWTACTYGGSRPWLHCPRCDRRYRFLYLNSERFACRLCSRLTYSTRRIHRDGGSESGWIEKEIDRLSPRMLRARSGRKRARLEARLARLGQRRDAIWGALARRMGLNL
jgi:hypothetical protein